MEEKHLRQREEAYRRIEARRNARVRRNQQRKRQFLFLFVFIAVLLFTSVVAFLIHSHGPGHSPESDSETDISNITTPEHPILEENYDHVDLTPQETDSGILLSLKELAADYPRIKKMIANIEIYPEELAYMIISNQETVDYAVDYPNHIMMPSSINLRRESSSETVPLLLQWDERWGYVKYGSGLIGWTGCGPTCMSMVTLYLTGNSKWNPAAIAQWSEENGYYCYGSGTSWDFMSEGSKHFGLEAKELSLVEQYLINELEEGHPIVCAMGPGDFTNSGHYIVIAGHNEDGFVVNDPNSRKRSGQTWTFAQLEPQISNLWAFSKA